MVSIFKILIYGTKPTNDELLNVINKVEDDIKKTNENEGTIWEQNGLCEKRIIAYYGFTVI